MYVEVRDTVSSLTAKKDITKVILISLLLAKFSSVFFFNLFTLGS